MPEKLSVGTGYAVTSVQIMGCYLRCVLIKFFSALSEFASATLLMRFASKIFCLVKFCMFRSSRYLKVSNRIIHSISVFMMDYLSFFQLSAKKICHNNSMSIKFFIANSMPYISMKNCSRAVWSSKPSQWISMCFKSLVMQSAKSKTFMGAVAVFNCASFHRGIVFGGYANV
jgi:hypothetical protein